MNARCGTIPYKEHIIQCYQWGTGPKKILLIHGWASHSYRWKSLIEHHKKEGYTFYAIDAPAHGLSKGRIMNIVILSDIISKFVEQYGPIDGLVGHSIGGYATLYFLHLHSYPSMKAVILGAPGEVTDFFEYYKKLLGLNSKTSELLNREFILRAGKTPEEFSSPILAASIVSPGLIIHDKKDRDTNFNYSVKLNAAWKNSQLILTEGLGHSLKSKELEDRILDFMS